MQMKKWVQTGLIAGALMLVYTAGGLVQQHAPQQAAAQEETQVNSTITVQGTGMLSASPDWSELRVGAETEGETVAAAQSATAESIAAIKEALLKNGVQAEDIKTAEFNVRPNYQYDEKGSRSLNGFVVTHILHVGYGELGSVGKVLDAAAKAGANRIDNVQFTIEDRGDLEIKALEKAGKHARAKAEALAAAAGKTIVDIQQVTEQSGGGGLMGFERAAADDSDGGSTSIEIGQVDVSKSISVTYIVK
ncbi:SIMPL domain-containing protein [Paenibacillus sp. IB182496]|uniref:SIMPL domain-containing protein n=1 Tax=Paenibacillus sabuli TaxID=2772509 RepID=A0A927GRV1_9BACL|nr:SIMPL domain-containing protein [Paenibacillus sabuli]MBD2845641.1 SIMPL domain-containing protein [Paenibacillus sabuli]